jgi:hypothetical protein
MRGLSKLLVAACGLVMSAGMVNAQQIPMLEAPAAADQVINFELLGLTGGEFFRMDVDLAQGQPTELLVPINGEIRALKLAPYSVRAPGFKLYEARQNGQLFEVDAGPVNTFRGTVDKQLNAIVAGGVMPDGVWATIALGADEQYWIEPVAGRVAGAPADLYVIYTADQVRQTGAACGVEEAQHRIGERFGGGYGERGATRSTAQVAVECDFEYFNLYGSSSLVNSRINLVYNVMNVQYERDVDIVHTIASTIVNTVEPDPYGQGTTGGMLDEMRLFWNANRGGITRDIAHLFTGKPTGGVIGTAYIGVVCNSSFGYGVSQTEFNNFNLSSAADLVAHETGHNWNSCHCPCSSPAFTMNPFVTSINRFGTTGDECGTNSIAAIVGHRNSRGCLTGGSDTGPLNNACSSAAEIGPGTWGFSNIDATTDGPSTCGSIGNDVWYTYVAPYDGTVVVSTCGTHDVSSFDTVVAAYSGFCGSLTNITCNDDNTGQCGTLDNPTRRDAYIEFAVTRGTRYYIQVGGFGGTNGSGLLNFGITGCSAPSNNACGNAALVGDGAFPFSTVCSSTDGFVDTATGCTAFGYQQTGSDIWYQYVASCTGDINASICGFDRSYDTRIALYAGCPSGPNQSIACSDDSCGAGSSLTWAATRGVSYWVRVGGFNGAQGTGTLVINPVRPANDSCSAATPIAVGGSATGSTSCASNDGAANCAASTTSPDVWYAFTADCSGFYVADTEGASNYDTALSVHTGCPGDLSTIVACDDDSGSGLLSRVVWQQTAGTTYYIRVNGYANETGNFQLNMGNLPNNACGNAIFVGNGTVGFSNRGATTDGVGNGLCTDIAGNQQVNQDVWFIYQATCAGTVTVDTFGSTFDTKLAVYGDAFACPPTNVLGCNDDTAGVQSLVSFAAVPGNYYKIRLGGYQTANGCGLLNIACSTPCPWQADGCFGDYNNDGGIDGDDVITFFGDWDNGNICADVTGDEGVDGDDVIAFFNSWDNAGIGFPGC